jgi:hypothetical protein
MDCSDLVDMATSPSWDEQLDDALLNAIFERLGPASLALASCACRRWRQLADVFWDGHLARLEPAGFRHGVSWDACGRRARRYFAWRVAW